MASPEEIKRLLDQLDRAYRRLGETNPFSRQETDVRKLEDALRGVEDRLNAIDDDFGSIVGSINASLDAMSKTNAVLTSTRKAFRGIDDITRKLRDDQSGIAELNLKDLKTLGKKLDSKRDDLKASKDLLENKKNEIAAQKRQLEQQQRQAKQEQNLATTSVARKEELEQQIKNRKILIKRAEEDLRLTKEAHTETKGFLEGQDSLYKIINDRIQARIAEEGRVNEALGLGGAAIDGMGKALDKMGLGRLKDALGLENVKGVMEDLAKKAAATGEEITFKDKLKVLKGGLREAGTQLMSSLKDPMVVFSFLLKQSFEALKRIDTRSADLRKNLGLSGVESVNLNDQLAATALTSEYLGVTTDALVKSINDLNSSLGDTAIIFDQDLLETATVLRERFNLSEEALAGMTKESLSTGKSLESIKDEQLESLVAAEEMYQVNLNTNKTLDKANKITGALRLNLEKAPGGLVKAVALATKLGLEIEQTAKMAGKLLDFESSIEAELEAELLTGKQLNLEQARYFALQGKTAEAAAEIAKQVGSSAEFASMNVIQQQALASAAGLTTDELANALRTQESIGSEAEKFRDRTAEQAEEAATALSIQDKLAGAVEKLAGVLEFSAIAASLLFGGIAGFIASGGPLNPFAGLIAIGAAITAGTVTAAALGKFKGDDIISPPPGGNGYGKRTLFGPEGSIALNDNDTIIAGTNLGGGKTETAPAASPSINIAPLIEQMNRMNATLQAILAKEGTVELDGTKVGTALTVGSYKLQ